MGVCYLSSVLSGGKGGASAERWIGASRALLSVGGSTIGWRGVSGLSRDR